MSGTDWQHDSAAANGSGSNHYAADVRGAVEIESEWTAWVGGPLIAMKLR
jgi:hypothetical protein